MPVDFLIALRGYDRRQVDELVRVAEQALVSPDPGLRAAVAERLRRADLAFALRGYSKEQVDRYLGDTVAALRR